MNAWDRIRYWALSLDLQLSRLTFGLEKIPLLGGVHREVTTDVQILSEAGHAEMQLSVSFRSLSAWAWTLSSSSDFSSWAVISGTRCARCSSIGPRQAFRTLEQKDQGDNPLPGTWLRFPEKVGYSGPLSPLTKKIPDH